MNNRKPRFLSTFVLGWVLLCLLYLTVRLLDIDRLVTSDEPFWLGASANFYRALVTGEFANTYQLEHPGVPTMWAGALAFFLTFREYAQEVPHNLDGLGGMYSIEGVLRGVDRDPLELMIAAKVAKVTLQTVYFGVALIFLRKIAGATITFVCGSLIVFGPFLTGLDSALHVDGMAAVTTFTGFCAIVFAAERSQLDSVSRRSMTFWAIAGFFAANAWLTRYPAVLLIGVAGLGLLLRIIWDRGSATNPSLLIQLRASFVYGLTGLLSGLLSTILLWPALWTAPRHTLVDMWNYGREAAGQGHEHPLIFQGVVKFGDPGWLFYPVTILWRTSPADWLGIGALLFLAYWAVKKKRLTPSQMRIVIIAVVYVFVFTVAQSFGAKKFDRYILPIYPPLMLVATIGLITLGQWLAQFTRLRFTRIVPAALAICINVAIVGSILPYRLDYFNPIMGGPAVAEREMQMGWGQGGYEVAEFLNTQPASGTITVQTSAQSSAFTYFLPDDTPIRVRRFDVGTPAGWYETDYYVASLQQTQRDLAPPYRLLKEYEPIHVVHINGMAYFMTFDVRALPLPESLQATTSCNFTFGQEVTLMQIIGRDSTIDFYFMSTGSVSGSPISFQIDITLANGDTTQEEVVLEPAAPGVMSRLTTSNPAAAAGVPLREAEITISATDGSDTWFVTAPWLTEESNEASTQSECYYTEPPQS